MTLSEENYLKIIYHLSKENPQGVSTSAIAQKMNTKASSVTDMMRRLSDKKLVHYVKYQGVILTKEGEVKAIDLVRRHRLWEVFLLEKLNFSWDEVHDIAEELEHVNSKKLIDRLDAFLGYPNTDPHGDPIPTSEGVIAVADKILLSEAELNKLYIFKGVKSSSKEFLQYLSKDNWKIGDEVKVLSIEKFDLSMEVECEGVKKRVSSVVAQNIFVMSKS